MCGPKEEGRTRWQRRVSGDREASAAAGRLMASKLDAETRRVQAATLVPFADARNQDKKMPTDQLIGGIRMSRGSGLFFCRNPVRLIDLLLSERSLRDCLFWRTNPICPAMRPLRLGAG